MWHRHMLRKKKNIGWQQSQNKLRRKRSGKRERNGENPPPPPPSAEKRHRGTSHSRTPFSFPTLLTLILIPSTPTILLLQHSGPAVSTFASKRNCQQTEKSPPYSSPPFPYILAKRTTQFASSAPLLYTCVEVTAPRVPPPPFFLYFPLVPHPPFGAGGSWRRGGSWETVQLDHRWARSWGTKPDVACFRVQALLLHVTDGGAP